MVAWLWFWMRFVGWVDGDNSGWSGLICEGGNWIWGLRCESKRNKSMDKPLKNLHRKHRAEKKENLLRRNAEGVVW